MIHGKYNALEYRIYRDEELLYSAGNSPLESQTYVDEEDGVGLDTMARYCKTAAHKFAQDNDQACEVNFCETFDD